MSKRVTVSKQEDYLHVYACFEQVSPDYVMMFCKVEFKNSLSSDYFQPLRFVSERQSVELLIDILQSSLSSNAAELLVHLTVINQVSATEVQNLLIAAIDNAQSQQIVDLWDSSMRIDQELRSLLIRLMVKEPDLIKSGGTIDTINETLHIPIPAAVFQTNN
jgi:hypothetical protein